MIRSNNLENEEALEVIFEDLMLRYRGVLPAVIEAVNFVGGALDSVDIQPAIKQVVNDTFTESNNKLPIIPNVPVMLPYATTLKLSVTIPIQAGDQCVIICCDRSIDHWKQLGSVNLPVEPGVVRTYDLTDAICIIGAVIKPTRISNYANDAVEIRNEDRSVRVRVSASDIEILNGSSTITTSSSNITLTASTVTINGVDFSTHTHVSNGAGVPTSGPS